MAPHGAILLSQIGRKFSLLPFSSCFLSFFHIARKLYHLYHLVPVGYLLRLFERGLDGFLLLAEQLGPWFARFVHDDSLATDLVLADTSGGNFGSFFSLGFS